MPRYTRRPEWLKLNPLDSEIMGEMGKLNQEKIDAVEKGLSKFKIS